MLLGEVRSRLMSRQKLEEFGNIKMLKEREEGRRPWKCLYKDCGGGREGRGFENPRSLCVWLI